MITAKQMHELADTCPTLGYGFATVLKEIEFAAKLGRYHVTLPYNVDYSDLRRLKDQGFNLSFEFWKTNIDWAST